SSVFQRVRDKSMFTDGNQRISPHNKKYTLGGNVLQFFSQSGISLKQGRIESLSCRWISQHFGQERHRTTYLVDGMRVHGIRGNSETIQLLHGFRTIETLNHKHDI